MHHTHTLLTTEKTLLYTHNIFSVTRDFSATRTLKSLPHLICWPIDICIKA